MKPTKRLLAVDAVAGAAAAAPLMFAANAATAVPATVKAETHLANRSDTCADCVTSQWSPNGYVWAYDNMSRQFTITQTDASHYTVDIADTGSFRSIADPVTGSPLTVNGSVKGTQSYTVTSTQAPNTKNVPSQIGDDTSTTNMITQDLFGGRIDSSKVSNVSWTYTYQAGGHTYTQSSAFQPPTYSQGGITG
jgi:hypothetical protein